MRIAALIIVLSVIGLWVNGLIFQPSFASAFRYVVLTVFIIALATVSAISRRN